MSEQLPPTHESSTMNVHGIFIFIAWFLAIGIALQIIVWLTLGTLTHHTTKRQPPESPIGSQPITRLDQPLQPSPGHPTLPTQDLAELKSTQLKTLNSYAPIPNDPTHAQIPITRAMQLLLDTGTLKQIPKSPNTQPYINTTQPTPTENRT